MPDISDVLARIIDEQETSLAAETDDDRAGEVPDSP